MKLKSKAAEHLAPLQCAVGVPAGGEKLFKAAQTFLEAAPEGEERVLLALDAQNAFNTMDRQKMMDELAATFPQLLDFFWQFYGQPAQLWYRLNDGTVHTIWSQEATQQGDAGSPLLFCLTLQPVLRRLKEKFPDCLVGAFMDDLIGGCAGEEAPHFVKTAEEELSSIKLPPGEGEMQGVLQQLEIISSSSRLPSRLQAFQCVWRGDRVFKWGVWDGWVCVELDGTGPPEAQETVGSSNSIRRSRSATQ